MAFDFPTAMPFSFENEFLTILVKGFISIGISATISIITFFVDKNFRYYLTDYVDYLLHKFKIKKTVKNEKTETEKDVT